MKDMSTEAGTRRPFAGGLAQDVLDALPLEVVILDADGRIVAVNAAWRRFAAANGWPAGTRPEGLSYLGACETGGGDGADEAALSRASLRALLAGHRREYAMEYPCHSPGERRWFVARASRCEHEGAVYAVITHEDITARRLAEERHRHVSQTLQSSLLTRGLPQLPWLEAGARFLPAAVQGLEVGGDFYDLVPRDDGGAVAVVGDVCGKGAAAAAVTGLARHTLRALAGRLDDPAELLGVLDDTLRGEYGDGHLYLTAACAVLRPDGDGVEAALALGGHPAAMVLRAGGAVEMAGRHGRLLGWSADIRLTTTGVRLAPGDGLVLYTDGVSEARRGGGDVFGDARLRAVGEQVAGAHPDDVAEALRRAGLAYSGGRTKDDIAVLALRVPPAA